MAIKTLVLTNTWMTEHFTRELSALLAKNETYDVTFKSQDALTASDFESTEVLIAIPSPEILGKFKQLRWLQLFSAGTNGYTQGANFPEHVVLTNASGPIPAKGPIKPTLVLLIMSSEMASSPFAIALARASSSEIVTPVNVPPPQVA